MPQIKLPEVQAFTRTVLPGGMGPLERGIQKLRNRALVGKTHASFLRKQERKAGATSDTEILLDNLRDSPRGIDGPGHSCILRELAPPNKPSYNRANDPVISAG